MLNLLKGKDFHSFENQAGAQICVFKGFHLGSDNDPGIRVVQVDPWAHELS